MEERLKLFLTMEGLSPSQFADKLGIQRSGVSHLLSGRNKPSFEFINKMLLAFPKINPDWLILGTGKAYRDLPSSPAKSAPAAEPITEAPTPSQFEAEVENAAATSTEPDLFFGISQTKKDVQQPLESPVAAANESHDEPNLLRSAAEQQPLQAPESDPVAPKIGRNNPRENPAVRPAAPSAREKRIAQITILYTDGTFEVR